MFMRVKGRTRDKKEDNEKGARMPKQSDVQMIEGQGPSNMQCRSKVK